MTELQLQKLGNIFRLARPSSDTNVEINIHVKSKQEERKIMRGIPKSFRRKTMITEHSTDWTEAKKSNIYGLGRLQVTVFYPKGKEVNK